MNNYCCVTWQELAPELVDRKQSEIDALIEEKGLPRSIFAPVIKVLNNMLNHCPVCGYNFVTQQSDENVKLLDRGTKPKIVPPTTVKKVKCIKCQGKGVLGHENKDNYLGSAIAIKCMNCHGLGWVDSRHKVYEATEELEHERAIEKRIEDFEAQGNVSESTE